MEKKRTSFLFGAGAAIAWNGPTTFELTKLVRKSGFKIKNDDVTITEFIYQQLLKNGFDDSSLNFETIVSVIEEFIVYYSRFDGDKKMPSILSSFFKPLFETDLFNFSIYGGKEEPGFKLQIPENVEYPFADHAYYQETPTEFFFEHLLAEIITNVNARVSKYAYHTSGNSNVIKTESDESLLFRKWMQGLAERRVLRMYSLNYDRLFKILLEREGVSIFEGFDCGEFIGPGIRLRANVPKMLTDFNSHVHYNLHGSAFWEVQREDKEQLPNPEFFLTGAPVLPVNYGQARIQIEKGKTIVLTNIITGYQKAQKAMITPFKQMQAAFDRDCCCSDELYIIGYSFGDEHINESVRTAVRHNPKLRVIVVDPSFMDRQMDLQFALKLFSFREQGNMNAKKVDENLFSFFDNAFVVHTLTFTEFLEQRANNPLWRVYFR